MEQLIMILISWLLALTPAQQTELFARLEATGANYYVDTYADICPNDVAKLDLPMMRAWQDGELVYETNPTLLWIAPPGACDIRVEATVLWYFGPDGSMIVIAWPTS